jgi:hypothetical protein
MNSSQFSTVSEPRRWALEPSDFDRPLHQLRWIADDLAMVAFDVQLGVTEGLGLSAEASLRDLLNELGVAYDGDADPRRTIAHRVARLIRLGSAAQEQAEREPSLDAFLLDVQEALKLPNLVAAQVWMDEHVDEAPSIPIEEFRATVWSIVIDHVKTHSTETVCTDCGPDWLVKL